MADGLEVSIDAGPEFERVDAALADESATLAMKLRDAVNREVEPWIADAEAAVISIPIKGVGRQSGLRREVAGSISKNISGAPEDFEVVVEASLPAGSGEENERAIPAGMDRETGWRHPVFGNRRVWVQQIPLRHHWFTGTLDDGRNDDVTNVLQNALEEAANNIAHAGG